MRVLAMYGHDIFMVGHKRKVSNQITDYVNIQISDGVIITILNLKENIHQIIHS